jgi:hypothetical protein
MVGYIVVSVITGIVFGIMDGVINAIPFARKLNEVYKPIARTSINIPAGLIIDLIYGFAMAAIFMTLYNSLPGSTGIIKGISFAGIAWFFRVFMSTASHWMVYKVPGKLLVYNLVTGLLEMLVMGLIYGGFLKTWA